MNVNHSTGQQVHIEAVLGMTGNYFAEVILKCISETGGSLFPDKLHRLEFQQELFWAKKFY